MKYITGDEIDKTYLWDEFRGRFYPKDALTLATLLGPQSRFGDNWGKTTWNLSGASPKQDWSSKRVKPL